MAHPYTELIIRQSLTDCKTFFLIYEKQLYQVNQPENMTKRGRLLRPRFTRLMTDKLDPCCGTPCAKHRIV